MTRQEAIDRLTLKEIREGDVCGDFEFKTR